MESPDPAHFKNWLRLQVRALRPQPNCEWSRKRDTLTGTSASICLIEETRGGQDFTTLEQVRCRNTGVCAGEECEEFTPTEDAAGKCVWTKVLPVLSKQMRQNRALTLGVPKKRRSTAKRRHVVQDNSRTIVS